MTQTTTNTIIDDFNKLNDLTINIDPPEAPDPVVEGDVSVGTGFPSSTVLVSGGMATDHVSKGDTSVEKSLAESAKDPTWSQVIIDNIADYGSDAVAGSVGNASNFGHWTAVGVGVLVGNVVDKFATEIGIENNWGDTVIADSKEVAAFAHDHSVILSDAAREVTHQFLEENAYDVINWASHPEPIYSDIESKAGYEVGQDTAPTFETPETPSDSHDEPSHEESSGGWFSSSNNESNDNHESSSGGGQSDSGHEESSFSSYSNSEGDGS